MKSLTLVFLIIFSTTSLVSAAQQTSSNKSASVNAESSAERKAWDDLKQRFTTNSNYISGNVWALIHTYESKTEMEQSLKLLESIGIALASNDPASMKKFDGPEGFKSQLLKFMNSKDDTASGFAAVILAIVGDMNYAPHIAGLLSRNDNRSTDQHPPTARAKAAVALALMGAKQYTKQIVPLLKSTNHYEPAGAAYALGLLKATEYAKDVSDLMLSDNSGFRGGDSAVQALFAMGVAANYKHELAEVLHRELESAKSAAYGLAHLHAKEYAGDIAKHMERAIQPADFAKALALMGATEYASKIGPLLKAERSSTQTDAALALGILGAREYRTEIAALLKDDDFLTRYSAAMSLILMEADEYAAAAVHEIEDTHKAGDYFEAGDFHVLVAEDIRDLEARFQAKLARMKAKIAVVPVP
jgi:HEAT repeat protein